MASFDCRSPYDPNAYAEAVLEEQLEEKRTVYANVFFGVGVGAAVNGYLGCCSSTGFISVFNVDDLLSAGPDTDVVPALVIHAHDGAVYSLVTHGGESLCSAGNDGRTVVWRISDVVSAADAKNSESVKPAHVFVNPQASKPRGALGPVPETNALASDSTRGVLFSAAGDGVCYGWDLDDGGRATPAVNLRGHVDGLHCVAARVGANQAVTGSEDGTVRIWDVRSEKTSHVVNPWAGTESSGSTLRGVGGSHWVGCVALDGAENWCAMGCGGGEP
ncbi:hypothetical protein N9F40_00575 [bacterium]|nr:hypothetical protein [bacterium]